MARARKAGEYVNPKRYKKLGEWLRTVRTCERRVPWQRLYDEVYEQKREQFLSKGMKTGSARKQAHLLAKKAVMDLSETSEQNVLRAIIPYE